MLNKFLKNKKPKILLVIYNEKLKSTGHITTLIKKLIHFKYKMPYVLLQMLPDFAVLPKM